ncbi:MAG: glycosyltransferase [Dehalococcoidia bacterium]|nr:glycosyltransferase [Dehalococcoidia bacterium]
MGSYGVAFRPTMTHRESLVYIGLMLVGLVLTLRYFLWWFDIGHIPGDPGLGNGMPLLGAGWIVLAPFLLLSLVEIVRVSSNVFLWVFALFMEDPLPMKPQPGLRIAVLTTIVPSREPVEIAERMLKAAKTIEYDGQVDLWLLDEGDDDRVKEMCRRIGVNHFSRKGVEKWNQPSGTFRAKTKAGNHNAWRDAHEGGYDLVAQMDPDHVPYANFLDRTIGYFRDPNVGYVVSPQIYGNHEESWIARGADEQSHIFHGVMQRGANGMGMPILIGTNHVYRPVAMQAAGGYAGIIVEDHATGQAISGQVNPDTGVRWKGVYVPQAVSVGEGPASWTDYLNQQTRWAYGIFEIIRDHDRRLLPQLGLLQRAGYLMMQSYYGFAALVFVAGNLLTFLYLGLGLSAADLDLTTWWWLWFPQLMWGFVIWYWLQRFYLYENQRGTLFLGYVLTFACLPLFARAAFAALTGRSIPYVVTAKGSAQARDSVWIFRPHMLIALAGIAVIAASFYFGNDAFQLRVWAALTIATTAGYPIAFLVSKLVTRLRRAPEFDTADLVQARAARVFPPPPEPQRPTPRPEAAVYRAGSVVIWDDRYSDSGEGETAGDPAGAVPAPVHAAFEGTPNN